MFSITLRRAVPTLAVMAGLLAVAGPAGASNAGNDGGRAVGVRDHHDVAVEGFMDYTDDALVFSGQPLQPAQASLGRENSIECLLRAPAPDEGQTQSHKPAPLNMTLCHEGFEIQ